MSSTPPLQRRPLAERQRVGWHVGPLSLSVQRLGPGLSIAWADEPEQDDDIRVDDAACPDANRVRLVCPDSPTHVQLSLMGADRNMVFRADNPLTLAPRSTIRAFVSSPVWVRIEAGGAVYELPSRRPTDTWFGTPLMGQLCYASKTALRVTQGDLGLRPHRAITPLILKAGPEPLEVKRLQIPIPELGLWRAQDGSLWTDTVALMPEERGLTRIKISAQPPEEHPNARRHAEPRRRAQGSSPLSVFNAFF